MPIWIRLVFCLTLFVAGAALCTFIYQKRLDHLLVLATSRGDMQAIRGLVESGADPNAREAWFGSTSLLVAVGQGDAEIVHLLLEKGADIDATSKRSSDSPLMHAASRGHTECTRTLLRHGACVNRTNQEGLTPLMNAAWRGHPDVVRLLLKEKAHVNIRCDMGTALSLAIRGLRQGDRRDDRDEVIRLLIETGARE